jgi:hypothetical protein
MYNMRSILAAAGLLSVASAVPTIPPSVNGKYFIVLKDGASVSSVQSTLGGGVLQSTAVHHTYDFAGFKGFAASLNETHISSLQSDPNVRIPCL